MSFELFEKKVLPITFDPAVMARPKQLKRLDLIILGYYFVCIKGVPIGAHSYPILREVRHSCHGFPGKINLIKGVRSRARSNALSNSKCDCFLTWCTVISKVFFTPSFRSKVETEAELAQLQAVTCLMGPFYAMQRACLKWLTAQGTEPDAAARFLCV